MIRVIGFDLDDTLWAVKPVIIAAEKKLQAHLAETVPSFSMDVETMRTHREAVMREDPNLRHQLTEMRRRVIERALMASSLARADAERVSVDAMEVFLAARNDITFFTGVEEGLAELHGHYEMGALTNGNADIRRVGLHRYFTFAFSAEEVGAPKPEPHLFEAALAHLGVRPEEMAYVGDDPALDVDAANRLGLTSVWMKNEAKAGGGETEPDAVISDLRELPDVIRKLSAG